MTSVVIPALNEGRNIDYVINLVSLSGGVHEVIVVDDGSIDDTRDAALRPGARVVTSSLLGKGASMEDGLRESTGDVIVYLDGDLRGLDEHLIAKLVEPIREGKADFVKARFSRSSGRVTTLTAKPLIETFFPEMAYFAQPLGGIIAVRREVLERLTFETDYGVDLALLIDAHFGGARIVEVDIGHLDNDSQSLQALGEMAKQVVRSLLHRAERHGRLTIGQVQEVEEVERHSKAEFAIVMNHIGGTEKLALFDMDGTLAGPVHPCPCASYWAAGSSRAISGQSGPFSHRAHPLHRVLSRRNTAKRIRKPGQNHDPERGCRRDHHCLATTGL